MFEHKNAALLIAAALITVGVVAAPLVHRYLHKFHLEDGAGR